MKRPSKENKGVLIILDRKAVSKVTKRRHQTQKERVIKLNPDMEEFISDLFLQDITDLYNHGYNLQDIGDYFNKDADEIFIALLHQSRRDKIKRPLVRGYIVKC